MLITALHTSSQQYMGELKLAGVPESEDSDREMNLPFIVVEKGGKIREHGPQ